MNQFTFSGVDIRDEVNFHAAINGLLKVKVKKPMFTCLAVYKKEIILSLRNVFSEIEFSHIEKDVLVFSTMHINGDPVSTIIDMQLFLQAETDEIKKVIGSKYDWSYELSISAMY